MGKQEGGLVGFRLSLQQRRLWALWGGVGMRRAQMVLELTGNVDEDALREALGTLVRRHEILRTTYREVEGLGYPVQVVGAPEAPPFRRIDLCALSPTARQERIEQVQREEAQAPSDAQEGSGLRCACILVERGAPARRLLLLSLPCLSADVQTLESLAVELAAVYRASPQAEEPMQYADFSAWQKEWLKAEEARDGLRYWQQRDLSPLVSPALPYAGGAAGGPGAVLTELDSRRSEALETFAAQRGSSAAALLLAAWQTLLWRLTGHSPVIAGVTYDGRIYQELEHLLGPVARCLPLACAPEPGMPFPELLKRVDTAVADAHLWQEYFVWEERTDETGRFSFPFGFELSEPCPERMAAGVRFAVESLHAPAEEHGLQLRAERRAGGFAFELRYDAARYGEDDARRILGHLTVLLEDLLARPEAAAGELEILSPEERGRLLHDFGGIAAESREILLHQLFEEQARLRPGAPAVQGVTYGELNARANRLARRLRRLGIGPEVTVAVAVERSPEMIEAVLAVLKAGGAYVPLDLEHPAARNAYILADSRAGLLITREPWLESLPPVASALCLDRDAGLWAAEDGADLEPLADIRSLAYVAYTSGSSGQPKGVMGTHGGAANYLGYLLRTYELGPTDRVLQVAALPFDAWIRDCLGPLSAGAEVVLPEAKEPAALLARLRAGGITRVLSIVPTLLRAVLAQADGDGTVDGLRTVLASGEPLFGRDGREVARVFGFGTGLVNQYGPTECTMTSTFHLLSAADLANGAAPVGRPIDNVRCLVLDERLEPTPVGVWGEIHIAGPGLTRGYQGRPDLTAAAFLPTPHGGTGERIYRTGDVGRFRPDGVLEVLGRRDNQVKVRGVRVELGEVEAALLRHSDLREAAAVVREVGGDTVLVAYVAATRTPAPEPAALRSFLRQSLPEAMVPSLFVFLDTLPRTPNGKLDRRALPAPQEARRNEGPAAPRTPVEELLAGIWEEVLGVGPVGLGDDFFDLGGHSLLATQVTARIQDAFGVCFSLRTLFDHSTLERLAAAVEAGLADRAEPLPPIARAPRDGRDGRLPLSFAQQRLWFLQRLDPGDAAYNRPYALSFTGLLDVRALAASLNEIVRRHETLRTRFGVEEGTPYQVIAPAASGPLSLVDLSGLPTELRESATQTLAKDQAELPFDLERDLMVRAHLVRRAAEDHVLLFVMHHIASDGWSTGVLVREASVLYRAFSAGEPSPLPELPVQYADYAWHQRRWLTPEAMEAELDYWRRQLAGGLPPLRLGEDARPGGPRRVARADLAVAPDLAEAVRAFSRQAGATPFMTLLAAFKTLLLRYTGQEDILVASPIANRDRAEVEGMIGFFVNMLLLRTDLSGNPTFRELVERIRQVALSAYSHRALPFEVLVDRLKLGGGGTPPVQAVFALQNAPPPVLELPGLELQPVAMASEAPKFDLIVGLADHRDRFSGPVMYRADLYSSELVGGMLEHCSEILAQVLANPDARLLDLALSREGQEPVRTAAGLQEVYGELEFNF
jgi:amino acid adenylation domain-containing protein